MNWKNSAGLEYKIFISSSAHLAEYKGSACLVHYKVQKIIYIYTLNIYVYECIRTCIWIHTNTHTSVYMWQYTHIHLKLCLWNHLIIYENYK